MIKAIIFDNGGVLVRDTWLDFLEKGSRELGMTRDHFSESLAVFVGKATKGEISFEVFLEGVKEKTKNKKEIMGTLKPVKVDKRISNFILRLKKNYMVALLTNDLGSFEKDNKTWKLERVFGENIFNSSMLKVAKPHPNAFLLTLKRLNLKPKEALFIDDKERNVAAARKVGMKGVLFKSLEDLELNLKKIGVKVD